MSTNQYPVLVNGSIVGNDAENAPFLNRASRLGDGFFETIRVINGRPHAWEAHVGRISACAKKLSFEVPPHFDGPFLLRSINKLLQECGLHNARLRLTFFRQGSGTYLPDSNKIGYFGEVAPLAEGSFQVKHEGLHLGSYKEMVKHRDSLSGFKLLGNHVYIQASIWAQAHLFEEVLIHNDAGHIIEATSSNLFVVSNGELLTTPLSSGCVGGVMRMAVINSALALGIPCFESQIDEGDLLSASEIFLTNAVQGIQWVRSFSDKRYFHKMSDMLVEEVNKLHALQLVSEG